MSRAHEANGQGTLSLSMFDVGDRIELHPATDRWMRGDMYGEVKTIGRVYLRVLMDRSGGIALVHPDNVYSRNGVVLQ